MAVYQCPALRLSNELRLSEMRPDIGVAIKSSPGDSKLQPGLRTSVCRPFSLQRAIQGLAAFATPGSFLEMQKFTPHPDLLN